MAIVDLSMIGLTGAQAHAERMLTYAQAEGSRSAAALNQQNARAQELQNEETEKLNHLDQIASERLQLLATGQAPADDPYAAAFAKTASGQRTDDSAAVEMEVMADTFERNGAPSRAAALRKDAMAIRKQESEIANDAVEAEQKRFENILKGSEVVSRTLGVARNEGEWEFAKQEIEAQMERGVFAMEPELWAQIREMPYDPEVAAFFRERALSAKDEADLRLKEITEARRAHTDAIRIAQGQTRINIAAANAAETRRANLVREKTSGAATTMATSLGDNDRDSITASLLAGPLAGLEKDDPAVLTAANQIGEDTKQILRDTPGITFEAAKNRAIVIAEQNGFLIPTTEKSTWGGLSSKTVPGKVAGLSAANPLPPPRDLNDLQIGKFYRNDKGEVRRWDGAVMAPVN